MTLPVSPNPISLNQVNVELAVAGTTNITLNNTNVRTLFNKPTALSTISMSDGHGKTRRIVLSYVFSADTSQPIVNLNSIGGYVAGLSDITITINSNICVYSDSTATAALRITGGTTGDRLYLVCNGFIMGKGGNGGGTQVVSGTTVATVQPTVGGPGINSSWKFTTITGSGYIGGGGGGGGYGQGPASNANTSVNTGGGGAGGGISGGSWSGFAPTYTQFAGAAGGGLRGTGANGTQPPSTQTSGVAQGGGGGRIMPGSGGALGAQVGTTPHAHRHGLGGGAGGGGSTYLYNGATAQAAGGGGGWGAIGGKGGGGNAAPTGAISINVAGGSGGAAGGDGYTGNLTYTNAGAGGGAAIITNSQGIGPITCTYYGIIT